ncbi:hypothetical protein GCM10027020_02660 [Nocardioides salsibiostraticola]
MSVSAGEVQVDDEGLHFADGFHGNGDVYFDEHHAWSFSAEDDEGGPVSHVRWPKRMVRWLNGTATVQIRHEDDVIFEGQVVFGDGEGRVRFVDKAGIPVMIDKWGLLQRPFSGRDSSVVDQMVEVTTRILDVMEAECGVEGWIAFGTLLGAAREGGVIGHDSDIDLAYLSEQATPAAMAKELYDISRALRRHGMTVLNKSGAFITVVFSSPDGAMASIDVYTCFYIEDRLHETATVRQVVPRSAIVPLIEMEFEGQSLPAPADPDAMLAVSYGPGWRVPDPSFRHEPGPEIVERFDGWFSSLMRQRRDWERFLADQAQAADLEPSDFASLAAEHLPTEARVIDVGAGTGQDALLLARRGYNVVGLDYARQSLRAPKRTARAESLPAKFDHMNLYDLRDVMTRAALVSRGSREPAIYAREVLETLDPDGLENFWRFVTIVLRSGGRLLLEGWARSPSESTAHRAEIGGGRLRPLDPQEAEEAVIRAGGVIDVRDGFPAGSAAVTGGPAARWRMMATFPGIGLMRDHEGDDEE